MPPQLTSEAVSLRRYFDDLAKSEPLSRQRESELAIRIKEGDLKARNELIEANLRFAIDIAVKYQHRGLSLLELISAGNLGLITAAERFDGTKGYKFISYAVWWIKQSIYQALGNDARTVRLPMSKAKMLQKITKAARDLRQEQEVEPDFEAIAAVLAIPVDAVEETISRGNAVCSLDATGDRDLPSHLDRVVDTHTESPDTYVLRQSVEKYINEVVNNLDDRERRVLALNFGLDGEPARTLEQIGRLMGVSRERIRQIRERALNKLRRPSCKRVIRSLLQED